MDDITSLSSDVIKAHMSKLHKIWSDMGYPQKEIESRRTTVHTFVEGVLQDMVSEEEDFKNNTILEIEGYLQQASALSQDLHMPVPMDCDENLPLLDMTVKLREKLEKFANIKKERLERLKALEQREAQLMEVLAIPKRIADYGNVPSETQLQEFSEYIQAKKEDQVRLQDVFESTRLAIMSIMQEMAVEPVLQFEESVLAGTHFQLSAENMTALRDLHQSMERRLTEVRALTTELREKLTLLWDRLDESYEQRATFLAAHPGHSTHTVKALKQEIKRCEVLKRENIKHFVEVVRKELEDWWPRCYYSVEQRAEFRHYTSDCFTEDLLELHEQEVHRLTEYYQTNSHIFKLMEERQRLWERMTVLEEEATHPNRLFGNRGGQLLLEEKERKTIQRRMPKIEAELCKHVEQYEAENGKPFLINGENIMEFLENQWSLHKENKEKEKQARKLRNQTATTVDGRSMCKSTTASAVKSAAKRKINTPGTSVNKRGRLESQAAGPAPARPVCAMSKGGGEARRRSKKVARKIFTATRKAEPATSKQDLTTYMDFQNHLEKGAKSCRSSAKLPTRCLREVNNTRVVTPMKTPLKPVLSLATRTNTPSTKSNQTPKLVLPGSSKVNATPKIIRTPTGFVRTPRYTPARGNLPFLI